MVDLLPGQFGSLGSAHAMRRILLVLITLFAALAGRSTASAAGVIYVVPGGAGSQDGLSWANAKDLAPVLSAAVGGDELWVKVGTYTPATAGLVDARTATFTLKSGVALYGGFAGTETARSQRNWQTNLTILSGDIGVANSAADNSYHVVTGGGATTTAVLDGFTIQGGNANVPSPFGGGGGGGMYNASSSPTLTNVTFSGNSASGSGGGMYNASSSPTLTNVTFSGNSAPNGGGMYNGASSPRLTNVTFSGNSASNGGGMFNTSGSPTIRNSILWGNTGGQIYNTTISPATVTYSNVQGGYAGTGNLNVDPLFVTPVPTAPSTAGNLRLQAGSPAINAGDPDTTGLPSTDLDGNARVQGGRVDMGAYEKE